VSPGQLLVVNAARELTPLSKDAASADEMLKSHGVILRRVAAYGLPEALRMTIGSEDDNRRVVALLAAFMGRP